MSSTKNLTNEEIEEAYGNINSCFDEQGKTKIDIMAEFGYSKTFIDT
jgi:hypothetical protein